MKAFSFDYGIKQGQNRLREDIYKMFTLTCFTRIIRLKINVINKNAEIESREFDFDILGDLPVDIFFVDLVDIAAKFCNCFKRDILKVIYLSERSERILYDSTKAEIWKS